MKDNFVSITLNKNDNYFHLKISNPTSEINILLQEEELINLLTNINEAKRSERKSIQAGQSANANVYWCKEEEKICILIGQDDETWVIGFIFETQIIHLIKKEFEEIKG